METNEIRDSVRSYIIDQLLFGYDEGFADDASFEDNGIIDSTGIFELIDHIEGAYGIKITDEEVLPENFDSLQQVTHFILSKLNS